MRDRGQGREQTQIELVRAVAQVSALSDVHEPVLLRNAAEQVPA
jgi:hypothetical protein